MKNIKTKGVKGGKLRVIPLGGLQEIGKNMTAFEYGDDIVVVDSDNVVQGFIDVQDLPGLKLM